MGNARQHVVVIGASMSGLLAARALESVFSRVTIIEKDNLHRGGAPRRSVPQGQHAHGLLACGRDVMESLFCGVSDELVEKGALEVDYLRDMMWVSDGQPIRSGPSAIGGLLFSRPSLEEHIRSRLLKSKNVKLIAGASVTGLLRSADNKCVTGVTYEPVNGSASEISADLVIDASGRGSHSPAWLREMGYEAPREEKVSVGVTYTTCTFRRNASDLGGKLGVVVAASPPDWRCGAMLAQEGDRWITSIGGYFGDRAPADHDGYRAFARTLPVPQIAEIIAAAEPLTPFATYSFVASLRRHYEELTSFPEGYLVLGDALCSFNPIYGQGMTVASLEARVLGTLLRQRRAGIARRFFKVAKSLIDVPWDIVVGNDLQHPRATSAQTMRLRLMNWYLGQLKQRLPSDLELSRAFLGVSNMKEPPSRLFHPQIVGRLFRPSHVRALEESHSI